MLAAVETTCKPKTWEVEARIRNSRSSSLRPSALHETVSEFFSKVVIYQEGQLLVAKISYAMSLSLKVQLITISLSSRIEELGKKMTF